VRGGESRLSPACQGSIYREGGRSIGFVQMGWADPLKPGAVTLQLTQDESLGGLYQEKRSMATALATPNGYQVMQRSVLGIGLTALASLMIACGGNEEATGGATESDAGNAVTSQCADARLVDNMSAEDYRLARLKYLEAEPVYSPVSPAQHAEAEFTWHRRFVEATPAGAQAKFAREVCSDLAWLGHLQSPQLATAALGWGYMNCTTVESRPPGEPTSGNEKRVRDTYHRIYLKARTILCPQTGGVV
jgi:hypothetical protein